MADPIINLFQTTLLVFYFITPAETVHISPGKKAGFEKTKIWTLQSTSQIPTENPTMCAANGKLLLKRFEQVSTVAVRAYCLCPEHTTGADDICDKEKDANAKLFSAQGVRNPAPAGIVPIDSDTPFPSSPDSPSR
jgi:hypothetical protein